MKRKQVTQVQKEVQLTDAMEMILYQKLTIHEFTKAYAEKYEVSEHMAEKVFKEVKSIIKERFKEKQDEIIGEHFARYFDLLKRAKDSNNKRVERETLADISKLYGLEQRKLDVTTNGEKLAINIILSDESDNEPKVF